MHTNSPQSYSVERTLRKQGYMPLQQYTTTLQGTYQSVYVSENMYPPPKTIYV